ncbi:hypothetical protein BSNK01_00100 [Bacillaceae bacterium]
MKVVIKQQTTEELQASARRLRDILNQIRSFANRVINDRNFASRFNRAVRERNRNDVRRLLRQGGISARISIDRFQEDQRFRSVTVTVSESGQRVTFRLRWRIRG